MRGKSKCQLPPGRVPEYEDAPGVDGILAGKLAQELVSGGHVFKAARPSSSGITNTPVFEIPGDKARFRERGAEKARMPKVVSRAPEAAVDKHRSGERPRTLRQPQVAELIFVVAVTETRISRRRSLGENVLASLHARRKAYQLSSSSVDIIVMLRLLLARFSETITLPAGAPASSSANAICAITRIWSSEISLPSF